VQLEYCVQGISECDASQATLGESGKGVRGESNYAECMCRPVRLFANSSGVMQPRAPGQQSVGCKGGAEDALFVSWRQPQLQQHAPLCNVPAMTSHELVLLKAGSKTVSTSLPTQNLPKHPDTNVQATDTNAQPSVFPNHPARPSVCGSTVHQTPIPHTGRILEVYHLHSNSVSHTMPVWSTPLTQHGPACVDDLQLTVAAEGLGVGRQTSSVPTVVWAGKEAARDNEGRRTGIAEPGGSVRELDKSGGLSCGQKT
jgi:hypothetical protein